MFAEWPGGPSGGNVWPLSESSTPPASCAVTKNTSFAWNVLLPPAGILPWKFLWPSTLTFTRVVRPTSIFNVSGRELDEGAGAGVIADAAAGAAAGMVASDEELDAALASPGAAGGAEAAASGEEDESPAGCDAVGGASDVAPVTGGTDVFVSDEATSSFVAPAEGVAASAAASARPRRTSRTCLHSNHPPTAIAAIKMITTPGTQRRSCAAVAVLGVHELCEWIKTGAAGRAESVVASVYSASMASGSKPRNCAVVRTNPRLKTPPGRRSQCSVSSASRKRVPMRVAEEISSSVTPRISRSLRRWTPKPSFAVDWLASCVRG